MAKPNQRLDVDSVASRFLKPEIIKEVKLVVVLSDSGFIVIGKTKGILRRILKWCKKSILFMMVVAFFDYF